MLRFCWTLLRQGFPVLILGACGVLLWPAIQSLDFADLSQSRAAIAPWRWAAAVGFTIASFWAVAQYDIIAHRQLDTRMNPRRARRIGLVAIALGQTLGFGMVTATLVRWRQMSGFGPGVASLVTGFVSLTFLGGMAAITAVLCLLPSAPPGMGVAALCVLAALTLCAVLAVLQPRLRLLGKRLDLPSLRAMLACSFWAAVDILCAAMAFYVLLPAEVAPPLMAFLPVFCLALGAGILSGTPAGAGPFEIAMFSLTAAHLPAATAVAPLVIAVVGFRAIYYIGPAIMAALHLAVSKQVHPRWSDRPAANLVRAPRAETGVIRQNGGRIERVGPLDTALWPTGQALVALFDPFAPANSAYFHRLSKRAFQLNRLALQYKCTSRTARAARAARWQVLRLAEEAILDPTRFDPARPACSGLRRKLRKAAKAEVQVRLAQPGDMRDLGALDRGWQEMRGPARGGTVGRFCPDYLAHQTVFIAVSDEGPVGFVSFHRSVREWTLDLVRLAPHAPDGTAHTLVVAAIGAAAETGCNRLSLSAVPCCPDPQSALWQRVTGIAIRKLGKSGLRQFKSAFAPRWEPLYCAAPSRLALIIGLVDVLREVLRPDPLPRRAAEDMSEAQHDDEYYELASSRAA